MEGRGSAGSLATGPVLGLSGRSTSPYLSVFIIPSSLFILRYSAHTYLRYLRCLPTYLSTYLRYVYGVDSRLDHVPSGPISSPSRGDMSSYLVLDITLLPLQQHFSFHRNHLAPSMPPSMHFDAIMILQSTLQYDPMHV